MIKHKTENLYSKGPNTMASLTITIGISGSGKSTWAKEWVKEAPGQRCRVNRDDLRAMLYGKASYTPEEESGVDAVVKPMVVSLLEADRDVVVDNTHLLIEGIEDWAVLADELGADFKMRIFYVDADEAKFRVRARVEAGGSDVVADSFIDLQAERFKTLLEALKDDITPPLAPPTV